MDQQRQDMAPQTGTPSGLEPAKDPQRNGEPDNLPASDPRATCFIVVNRDTFERAKQGMDEDFIHGMRPFDKLSNEIRMIYQRTDTESPTFDTWISAEGHIMQIFEMFFGRMLGDNEFAETRIHSEEYGWLSIAVSKLGGASPAQIVENYKAETIRAYAELSIARRIIERAAAYMALFPAQGRNSEGLSKQLISMFTEITQFNKNSSVLTTNLLNELEFVRGENRHLLSERGRLEMAIINGMPAFGQDQMAFNNKRDRDYLRANYETANEENKELRVQVAALLRDAGRHMTPEDATKIATAQRSLSEGFQSLETIIGKFNGAKADATGGFAGRMDDLAGAMLEQHEIVRGLKQQLDEREVELKAANAMVEGWRQRAQRGRQQRRPHQQQPVVSGMDG